MSKGKILVVDPDEDIRNLLNIYFTEQGYEVVCVADGASALKATQDRNLPDIVVTELELPDMDGYAVVTQLDVELSTSEIPIIFLQERNERSDIIGEFLVSRDNYITKPFDIMDFKLRIENAITSARRAKDYSPISNRPKSHLIIEHLNNVKKESRRWNYLDISVQNFEAFLGVYGRAAGDGVIRTVSYVLGEVVDKVGTQDDFIGYPERNHFVVITHTGDTVQIKQKLTENINKEIIRHYNLTDRKLGYIQHGDEQVELMSLAITEIPHTYFSEQWDGNLPKQGDGDE